MIQKFKSMKVSEIMTRPVVCTNADISAQDILTKLEASHFSGMPVIDDNSIIGIVSESDILQLFLQGKNLNSTLAHEFMTRKVITATSDSLALSAIKAFIDNQILRLPITHQGKLVGIVTRHDLLKCITSAIPEFSLIP
jgi:tRNA nucleotidyltransferase (CCA-adding enzyme)